MSRFPLAPTEDQPQRLLRAVATLLSGFHVKQRHDLPDDVAHRIVTPRWMLSSFGLVGNTIFNSLRLASTPPAANAQVYGVTYFLENSSEPLAFDLADSSRPFVFTAHY